MAALLLVLSGSLGACSSDSATLAGKRTPRADSECLARGNIPKGVDARRPAVAIKVENDPAARPLSGLEKADVVFEEVVEGGITRFMAIYHCGESPRVGPVRSARWDDPKILLPFTKVLAFSGSNSIVGGELKRWDIQTLVEGIKGEAFYRIPPGSLSVHSVFAATELLRDLAIKGIRSPSPGLFPRGALPKDAKKAAHVEINFAKDNTIEYRWQKGAWHRYEAGEPFMTKAGPQIAVPNLLIQEVKVDNSNKIRDIEGNPSPELTLVGTGRAVLLRDGRALEGGWEIRKKGAPTLFQTKDGDVFKFADGPIWVELVPSAKGDVKGHFSIK